MSLGRGCWYSQQISTPLTSGATWWLMQCRQGGPAALLTTPYLLTLKETIRTYSFEHSLRSRISTKIYIGLSHSSLISELSTLFRIWIQAASNVWALTDGARKIQTLFPSGPFRIQIPKDRCREHAKPTVQTFHPICCIFFFFLPN